MNDQYTYIREPAHGWVGVHLGELRELGIASEISPFSYWQRNGHMVWLEEDADMARWLEARAARALAGKGEAGPDTARIWITHFMAHALVYRDVERTHIRDLPDYIAADHAEVTHG